MTSLRPPSLLRQSDRSATVIGLVLIYSKSFELKDKPTWVPFVSLVRLRKVCKHIALEFSNGCMAMFVAEWDGVKRKLGGSYTNRREHYPDDNSLASDDVVERYLVNGLMPQEPFITPQTPIVAFGSCFASNISKHLHNRDYNVITKREGKSYITRMGDGMTHTAAIRQQFEWAWENKFPTVPLWHGYNAEEFGYAEDARLETKALFDEAEVFIITLGLSEIWYDEPTGEVFWRVPPPRKLDAERHKFRVATFEETKRNIEVTWSLIKKHRPGAKIVITVSPIALAASFRPEPCISSNAASKAIVRGAVDEFYREFKPRDPDLYYFPSYDIVSYAFNNQYMPDRRHVNAVVLDFNMKVFERYFCSPGISSDELLESFRLAQALDEHVRDNGQQSVVNRVDAQMANKVRAKMERLAERRKAKNDKLLASLQIVPSSFAEAQSESGPIPSMSKADLKIFKKMKARADRKAAKKAGLVVSSGSEPPAGGDEPVQV